MSSPFSHPYEPGTRSFSSYPGLFFEHLTGQAYQGQPSQTNTRYEKVIFVFLDAFGLRFLRRFADSAALLKRALDEGSVEECRSQFPSTTACHTTTIHFGMPVAESGIFEWNYFEPAVGELISPLIFSYTCDHERETLSKSGIANTTVFPFESFYRKLARAGIPSYVFQNRNYTPSSFSDAAFEGATVYPYASEEEGIAQLAEVCNRSEGPGYYFLYLDTFDTICHKFGPDTTESDERLLAILESLRKDLVESLSTNGGRTVFYLSADHGQVEIDPEATIYLDREFPDAPNWFRRGKSGNLLVPGGSSRDLFLYVREECVDSVFEQISHRLEGVAEVRYAREMMRDGYFGTGKLSQRLSERMSELVVLPFKNQSVWWSENGKYHKNFRGHHGGLTPQEMEIPLVRLAI